MRNKCFNLHRFLKKAGAKNIPGLGYNPEPVSPYNWNNSQEPEDVRKQLVERQFADILKTSETPLSDSYGAFQKRPFQEGYGSSEHMMPIHQLYRELEAYSESLSPEEKKKWLTMWDGDLRNALKPALTEMGIPYNSALFDAFSQRMTPGKIENLFKQPPEEVRLVAENHKKSWIKTFQAEVMQVYKDLIDRYDVTPGEFTHLCYIGEVNPNKPSANLQFAGDGPAGYLIDKLGGLGEISRVTSMLTWILYEHPRQIQVNSDETRRINHLYSGYNEKPGDRDIYPNPTPITKDEILEPLGFTMTTYPPNKPSWEIAKEKIPYEKTSAKALTYEQKEERNAAWERQRLNPVNLEVLRKYILEGGFEYGGLGALIGRLKKKVNDGDYNPTDVDGEIELGDRRYPSKVIKYIFDQLCQRNGKSFQEMLQAAGLDYLKSDIEEISYPDPDFENFNLSFRSQAEKDVVEKLRKFGLMAVPMPISIPSPYDCTVNPRSFDIDFTIPCDVLKSWNMKYGQAHPQIQQTVIFVGEYFGYDRKQTVTIPMGQEWKNPDGTIAQYTNSNGESVDAVGGAEVERGFKYKLAAQWKKVCETYVSHMMGNSTIFIEKNSKDKDIIAQLDSNHIIYKPNESNLVSICAHQIEQHLISCNDPECVARQYTTNNGGNISFQPKQYSRAESYIISCIEDLKVKHGFFPTAKRFRNDYNSKEMYEYYTLYQARVNTLTILWKKYENAMKSKDTTGAEAFMEQYNTVRDGISSLQERHMSKLKEKYNQQLQTPMYQVREKGLQALLNTYRLSGGQIEDKLVAMACAAYMGSNPPAELPPYILEKVQNTN